MPPSSATAAGANEAGVDRDFKAWEGQFSVEGRVSEDLANFKTITLYIGTADSLSELEPIFQDYARQIGEEHVAISVLYSTADYDTIVKKMECRHLAPFEVPAVVYLDRSTQDCYYFSYHDGQFIASALRRLRSVVANRSSAWSENLEFNVQALLDEVFESHPELKPVRRLAIDLAQHLYPLYYKIWSDKRLPEAGHCRM